MTTFIPAKRFEALAAGMALRVGDGADVELLRVTHVFDERIYVMRYTTPSEARLAKRPHCLPLSYVKSGKAVLGRIVLPSEFTAVSSDTERRNSIDAGMEKIQPLVELFKVERNLARCEFTKLIQERAYEIDFNPLTLRKVLFRFYYFGEVKAAVLGLRPGPAVGSSHAASSSGSDDELRKPKRRGRQPIEAERYGRNEFVVLPIDIDDMLAALNRKAKASTTIAAAHDSYLDREFRERHPKEYEMWVAEKCPMPVTYRQFYGYVKEYEALSTAARKNVGALEYGRGRGGLVASGPGEIYEIDATGGRIHIVHSKPPHKVLATPTIYLLIDRWSRYVLSVYVTLGRPSWEEIRYALLIAFTEREDRFGTIGVNVTSERWPVGRVCATLVRDRGVEMISEALLKSAVEGLRITPRTLPAYCPDGKGIIERLNRTIKAKMAAWGLAGVFARRPTDAPSKKEFRDSKAAAARNLADVYRELIEIVIEYNNSSHKTLEKRSALKAAGVAPTPQAAYLWGLKNLTGIQSPPFTDADYRRLMLGADQGTIHDRRVFWKKRAYKPVNAAAMMLARRSTHRSKLIGVRVDKTCPITLWTPNGNDDWPLWHVDDLGLQELRAMTLEEEEGLYDTHRLLVATTRNEGAIRRSKRSLQKTDSQASRVPHSHSPDRVAESSGVKAKLVPLPKDSHASAKRTAPKSSMSAWEEAEAKDRAIIVKREIEKHR